MRLSSCGDNAINKFVVLSTVEGSFQLMARKLGELAISSEGTRWLKGPLE